MEAWIEVNLDPKEPVNWALLEVVDALVHDEFKGDIETWFYFWEPWGLCLRVRWREPARREELDGSLRSFLDREQKAGRIIEWYEGAHGNRDQAYVGEADHYGAEIWPQLQKDWMSGCELALSLITLQRDGQLTQAPEYHWSRRLHLFSSPLFGSVETEVELSLSQGLGALTYLLSQPGYQPSETIRRLVDELQRLADPAT